MDLRCWSLSSAVSSLFIRRCLSLVSVNLLELLEPWSFAVVDPSSPVFLDVELESISDLSRSLELDGLNAVSACSKPCGEVGSSSLSQAVSS